MDAPYGLIIKPKFNDGVRISKYYFAGPFVCFDMIAAEHRTSRRQLLNAFTIDGGGINHVMGARLNDAFSGFGMLDSEARGRMTSSFAASMAHWRQPITELQERVFSDPIPRGDEVVELATKYIGAGYFFNAWLLLDRFSVMSPDHWQNDNRIRSLYTDLGQKLRPLMM